MSKLPKSYSFFDLSDYGRPIATLIAKTLKNTSVSPIQVTVWFIIAGIIGICFIYIEHFYLAGIFLILKSILDAVDGELARVKQTPSYTGRYFDSISDILLNALIFFTIWLITDTNIFIYILAFFGLQLQGTLYNYYYVILRNKFNGDKTSRVFEKDVPKSLPGEKQSTVNFLFKLYKALYGVFDFIIYKLDPNAYKSKSIPKWLMTLVSTFGLGFQLLIITVMLILGLKSYIIPFFLVYSLMIIIFIGIRKYFYHT